jgi:hypothetical protein
VAWVDPERVARDWHWTENAGRRVPVYRVEVDDPDLPDPLIACGKWAGMTVELAGSRGTRVLRCDDPNSYVAFDPESDGGRLYLVLSGPVREVARKLWRPRGVVSLEELAQHVGGRHVDGYPDVDVYPVGPVLQVEYYAKKYGFGQGADRGATFYHDHQATLPWLAVSDDGRLWYSGGDYDATDVRGIVG